MEEDNMKIDYKKYQEQKKENILNKGTGYCRAEILLEHDDDMPIININMKHVSTTDVAKFCICMEQLVKTLQQKYPIEFMLGKKLFGVQDLGNQGNKEEN